LILVYYLNTDFAVRIVLPIEAIAVAPAVWSLKVEVDRVSDQMIRVRSWRDDCASDVLAFFSESVGDLNSDAAIDCESVHLVHFAFETSVDFNAKTVVALDVGVGVSDQIAVSAAAAARSAAALSA